MTANNKNNRASPAVHSSQDHESSSGKVLDESWEGDKEMISLKAMEPPLKDLRGVEMLNALKRLEGSPQEKKMEDEEKPDSSMVVSDHASSKAQELIQRMGEVHFWDKLKENFVDKLMLVFSIQEFNIEEQKKMLVQWDKFPLQEELQWFLAERLIAEQCEKKIKFSKIPSSPGLQVGGGFLPTSQAFMKAVRPRDESEFSLESMESWIKMIKMHQWLIQKVDRADSKERENKLQSLKVHEINWAASAAVNHKIGHLMYLTYPQYALEWMEEEVKKRGLQLQIPKGEGKEGLQNQSYHQPHQKDIQNKKPNDQEWALLALEVMESLRQRIKMKERVPLLEGNVQEERISRTLALNAPLKLFKQWVACRDREGPQWDSTAMNHRIWLGLCEQEQWDTLRWMMFDRKVEVPQAFTNYLEAHPQTQEMWRAYREWRDIQSTVDLREKENVEERNEIKKIKKL